MPGECMWNCGGKATLGQVFIDVLPSSTDSNIPPMLHKLICFVYGRCYTIVAHDGIVA